MFGCVEWVAARALGSTCTILLPDHSPTTVQSLLHMVRHGFLSTAPSNLGEIKKFFGELGMTEIVDDVVGPVKTSI